MPSYVREAMRRANEERPGPCHIELPEDVARELASRLPPEALAVIRTDQRCSACPSALSCMMPTRIQPSHGTAAAHHCQFSLLLRLLGELWPMGHRWTRRSA